MSFFIGKKILLISPEPWGTSFVSKHHYAQTLADMGNDVWFLEPPHHASGPGNPFPGNVKILHDTFVVRGLRFLPFFLQKILLRKSASRIEKVVGTKFDVIWSFDNSRHFDLSVFGTPFRIHHVVDIGMNYHLPICAQSASLALASNQSIFSLLKKYQPNTHLVHHGFSSHSGSYVELESPGNRVKAAYSGNLLIPFINWPLVLKLVRENSNVDFFFIGSFHGGNMNSTTNSSAKQRINQLREMNNVKILGEKSPAEVHSLLSSADILLLFYDHHRYSQQVENPHKVMSYLGTGRVILSNPMPMYEKTRLIEMEDQDDAYLSKFAHVCSHLDFYNTPEKMKSRIDFAKAHSYLNQVNEIGKLLEKIVVE
jgi:hypothetical protein